MVQIPAENTKIAEFSHKYRELSFKTIFKRFLVSKNWGTPNFVELCLQIIMFSNFARNPGWRDFKNLNGSVPLRKNYLRTKSLTDSDSA